MVASVDGRTLIPRWRPADAHRSGVFDRLHARLGGDAWLVGRITGQEYARRDAYPAHTDQRYARQPWFARRDAAAYGVVLDAHGKIAWGRSDIGDDPIVAVLTEKVSNSHLMGLRQDRVSYMFAGKQDLDLGLALDILNRELGIQRLLLEGGGVTNGAFPRAGLIDELSLVIFPAVDGAKGAPCVFDSGDDEAGAPAQLCSMTLESSQVLEGGAVWLRYRLQSG
jgi:riboflavin biosynthesis pyrimidine reductase